MQQEKVFAMDTGKVIPLLVAKAERKGRTKHEVYAAICWLTGYAEADIDRLIDAGLPYGRFFSEAPRINPAYELVTGSVCGVKVQEIADPLMRQIRCLDKLVDELAKGKPLDKVLRKG